MPEFLMSHMCNSQLPCSSKAIIFSVTRLLQRAFRASSLFPAHFTGRIDYQCMHHVAFCRNCHFLNSGATFRLCFEFVGGGTFLPFSTKTYLDAYYKIGYEAETAVGGSKLCFFLKCSQ